MIRIIVVDDEPLFRRGLIACVQWEENGMQIIGEASNGAEAIDKIRLLKPNVVLLDVKMPVMDGVEVVRTIMNELPDTCFIMLSCMNEFELVRDSMKYGAKDYLFKPVVTEEEILRAIHEQKITDQPLTEEEKNDTYVTVAIDFIQKHYMEPLTLDQIAQAACISKNYLCSIFHRETNETPIGYLTRYRITEARRLFQESNLPALEICMKVGFNDYSHFSKTYRKLMKKSPSQERRNAKKHLSVLETDEML